MTLHNVTIFWEKGEHGYIRGITGRKNYPHSDGTNFYNGHGGARMNTDMVLRLIGLDSNGTRQEIDIRHYLVEALGRKNMNQALFDKIIKCLPAEINIDNASGKISNESLRVIAQNFAALEK